VLTPRSLLAWLLALESSDNPQRAGSLRNGYELARLAASDGLIAADEQGHCQLAMALGELRHDDWLRFDWQIWPNDAEPANGRLYQPLHLQRMDNIRLTPQGIAAQAVRGSGTGAPPPSSDRAEERGPAALADDAQPLRDAFISHASEDKDLVARPLKEALEARGHTVWFDEAELVVGSSLSESIDKGLAVSRFGVVILSRSFFAKNWPRRELQGLVAKEMAGGERLILPVWHDLGVEQVVEYSPPLADLLAANTDDGIEQVADQISRAISHRRGLEEARGRPLPAKPAAGSPAADDRSIVEALLDLRDRIVGLIRADDQVGIRELLRAERRHFETTLLELLATAADAMDRDIDLERLRTVEARQWALVQRRAATVLPLIEYAPERLEEEFVDLAQLVDRRVRTHSTLEMWRSSTRVAVWMLVHLVGAYAVADDRFAAVRALWQTHTSDGRPLGIVSQRPAERLSIELARARPHTHISSRAVPLWHLAFSVASSDFLVERYNELVSSPGIDDPVGSLLSRVGDFSWLMTALAGKDGLELEQWWRAGQVHPTLPDRLTTDWKLREALAGVVFGQDSWGLSADVSEWVARSGGTLRWE
jgi:hypothetical protein